MANKQADKYREMGNDEFRKGEFAKAIEYYTYATEMDPKNPVYLTNRSMCYFKMEEYEKSLRDANKAVSLDGNWAKGYYRAGAAQLARKEYKEALANFDRAASIEPSIQQYKESAKEAKRLFYQGLTPAEITKLEGNDYFKSGDIDKAIDKYSEAIAQIRTLDDKTKVILADIYSNRAMCYQQRWDSKKVIEDSTKALELVPSHAKALVRRAQAYEALEKYQESLDDFEMAVRLQPNMDVAHKGAVRVRGMLRRTGAI
uniref:Stress-induced-phosphoprotein 1 n=2 Tax=Lygus hesperus TaxID=30085 RepID=A0A146L0Q2_LYGHE